MKSMWMVSLGLVLGGCGTDSALDPDTPGRTLGYAVNSAPLTIDDKYLYLGGDFQAFQGIQRVPLAGGAVEPAFETTRYADVVADSDALYVVVPNTGGCKQTSTGCEPYSNFDGSIVKVSRDGSTQRKLVEGRIFTSLAQDSDHLYFGQLTRTATGFTTEAAVMRVAKDGTGQTVLATGDYVTKVAVDSDNVYWLTPGNVVYSLAKAEAVPSVYTQHAKGSRQLVPSDGGLVLLDYDGSVSAAHRGGDPSVLATGAARIGVSGNRVFWNESSNYDRGGIYTLSLSTPSAARDVAVGGVVEKNFVVAADTLYYASNGRIKALAR